jgi:hypothetical protein
MNQATRDFALTFALGGVRPNRTKRVGSLLYQHGKILAFGKSMPCSRRQSFLQGGLAYPHVLANRKTRKIHPLLLPLIVILV